MSKTRKQHAQTGTIVGDVQPSSFAKVCPGHCQHHPVKLHYQNHHDQQYKCGIEQENTLSN